MKNSLRLSMSWLHTWGGIWASWILFAIFFTGTLGVFNEAITHWMKPEPQPPASLIETNEARIQAVQFAQQHLEKVAPRSHFWSIDLPEKEDPAFRIYWEDEHEQFQERFMNPLTGEVITGIPERKTEGGRHFVRLHYKFQAGTAGTWIVGFFAMAMLVGLISGIIIHKRIFKDFFTFRPGKNQRSWLDIHNATGVLTLPFQLMITYTGLAIFFSLYMPAAINVNYQETGDFFDELLAQPAHRDETHIDARVARLDTLFIDAEKTLQRKASFIVVDHPGDTSATITVHGPFNEGHAENFVVSPDGGRLVYDGVTGEILDTVLPRAERGGPIWMVQQAMAELHMVTFGDYAVKWLYFLCGLAGSAMIATGSILFIVKRRKRSEQEFGAKTQQVYSVIDSFNVAAIAGLMLSCVAYLWINRILPIELEARENWEVRSFFIIWLCTFLYALFRPTRAAWIEQLCMGAILCITLPVINILTTGKWFIHYWQAEDWLRLGTELTVISFGVLLTYSVWKIKNLPQTSESPSRRISRQTDYVASGN